MRTHHVDGLSADLLQVVRFLRVYMTIFRQMFLNVTCFTNLLLMYFEQRVLVDYQVVIHDYSLVLLYFHLYFYYCSIYPELLLLPKKEMWLCKISL